MNKPQILEGSRAIALIIKNIAPAVISAYPITPQTHIVEDLAKFKADSQADYEYIRAESEFAAASIILGASATGVRVYSATSSQGLLLMTEVIYNIAGMRLPIVMTCANRAVSAPINIWNDQQDVMTIRDAGWILLFAENHQEAVDQHIIAYKLAEQLKLPVIVNVDGFIMTHSYEPVIIYDTKLIKKYLPDYKPTTGQYLDPENPITLGALVTPTNYMEIRQELHNDLIASLEVINKEYKNFKKIFNPALKITKLKNKNSIESGLLEYYGPKNASTILIAMGSVIGTIKDTVDNNFKEKIGILKIKCFRPFPEKEILQVLKSAKYIAVLDKSISLGHMGCLASDIKAICTGKISAKIQNFIVGLGGKDITSNIIKKIIIEVRKKDDKTKFIGK
ncbi:MAG: pyruvate ferredoxin oxidoreductase [bacterium]|nr:pyruvate ferredoxin oxidoreductase [bacterium]